MVRGINMIDEIRLKEVCADKTDLEKLKTLLSKVGAKVEFTSLHDSDSRNKIVISYDTAVVRRKTKREAGRKRIKTGLYYTIAEVRERVKEKGMDSVLSDLGISESTYYRRMRYYRNNKIDETELFD